MATEGPPDPRATVRGGPPTAEDAARLLQKDGRTPADYVLFRTADEAPWNICVVVKGGGLMPLPTEDEDLLDLCRMILLTEGSPRFASVQALGDAVRSGSIKLA